MTKEPKHSKRHSTINDLLEYFLSNTEARLKKTHSYSDEDLLREVTQTHVLDTSHRQFQMDRAAIREKYRLANSGRTRHDTLKQANTPPPIRSYRKCYFCSEIRISGVNWCVRCTNVARYSSYSNLGWLWAKADHNLPCWREPEG